MTDDKRTDQPPTSIDGSLFCGDVDNEGLIVGGNLTVQGIGAQDLDKLTGLILDALRSSRAVTITGGKGDATVLAVDGESRVEVSREQGAALARRTAGRSTPGHA
jgi:hypothetical protein